MAQRLTFKHVENELRITARIVGWQIARVPGAVMIDYNPTMGGYHFVQLDANSSGGERIISPGWRMTAREAMAWLHGVQHQLRSK